MKSISIRLSALTAATVALLGLAGGSSVSAAPGFVFHVTSQAPPPPQEDYQWARPYHTAVWIPGHYVVKDLGYVWIGGYYDYPPHPGSHWVPPRYDHHVDGYIYRSGHWSD
jgi:hypothetical protein